MDHSTFWREKTSGGLFGWFMMFKMDSVPPKQTSPEFYNDLLQEFLSTHPVALRDLLQHEFGSNPLDQRTQKVKDKVRELRVKPTKELRGPRKGTLINFSYDELVSIFGPPNIHNRESKIGASKDGQVDWAWSFRSITGKHSGIWSYNADPNSPIDRDHILNWTVGGESIKLLKELFGENVSTP